MATGTRKLFGKIKSNHPKLGDSGFAFVLNVDKICEVKSFKLAENITIRKANGKETNTIQFMLKHLANIPASEFDRNPYETSISRTEQDGQILYNRLQLPKDMWRYTVLSFDGQGNFIHDLESATVLCKNRIAIGLTIHPVNDGQGHSISHFTDRIVNFTNRCKLSDSPFHTVTPSDADEYLRVAKILSQFDNTRIDLQNHISRVQELDSIRDSSPLRFLGFMAVIESIITHAPKPSDPSDSLTRQVTQKMILVGNRITSFADMPIPYELFRTAPPETLWKKLYAYRSCIAHGGKPDFDNNLHSIKGHQESLEFVSRATSTLMRLALHEPNLIADLHAC